MNTKILKLTALLVLMLFANINLANAQTTPPVGTPVISLTTTTAGDTVRMKMKAATANTPVWIETASGSYQTATVGTNYPTNYTNYKPTGTSIKVYGNITGFDCGGESFYDKNPVSTLDASGNTNLQELHCYDNQLTSLNVQGLTNLLKLYCSSNQLTNLNVQGLTNLLKLYCGHNQLTGLNVQDLTNLQELYCSSNQLTNLNVQGLTNLKTLDCSFNKLTSLNMQSLTNLKTLECYSNPCTKTTLGLDKIYCQLPEKQVSDNARIYVSREAKADLETFILATNRDNANSKNWKVYGYDAVGGTYYEITNTTGTFVCGSDTPPAGAPVISLTTAIGGATVRMKMKAATANTPVWIETSPNYYQTATVGTSYPVSYTNYNPNGTGTSIKVYGNITGFDCEGNTGLGSKPLSALDASGNTDLQELDCYYNQLTNLNVQGLTSLQKLSCSDNQLTNLNVQGLTNLQELSCSQNQLTSLNVQGLTNLQKLSCSSNKLTSLNVQSLTNLQELYCSSNNQLTSLNVQGLNNLQKLYCGYDQLTSLNVQGLTNLQTLSCSENQLTSLNVQSLTNLQRLYCYGNPCTSTTLGLDQLYCQLPERQVSDNARIYVSGETQSNIETFVLATNGANANNKYWKLYCSTNEITNTTGTYTCETLIITTLDATNITKTTATLNAVVKPGEEIIDEKGFEWKKTTGGTYVDVVCGSTGDTITANLTGLTPNTGYTFRAYAKIGATKKYGAETTFTTLDIIHATVSTLNATDVDHTVATLNGVVKPGEEVIAEKGFEWKKTAGGTYADVVSSSTGDTITANLSGLTPNTDYTFRAYAKIGIDKKYGAEYTFTTVEATLNIHRWIDIKVSTQQDIKLGFAANDPTTSIKVVYRGTSQTINGLTTEPSSQQEFYTGYNNNIRIYGDLSGLDCSGNGTNLSEIDASNNTELSQLICDRNWLWRLDVSKNTALRKLSCNKNYIDTLNVSNNTVLHTLSCNSNRLTILDVSNNPTLRVLSCYGNQLTVQALDKIYCDLPEITAPDFGTMYPIENATSGDSAIIKRTSSQNAINNGWKLQYGETFESIPATTGNYTCGTVIPATVTTLDATNVSYTTATLNSVVAPGSNIINDIGFMYKETEGGTYSAIMGNYTTDEVAIEINNLIPGTNYTFKAYAILSSDTIFGTEKTFTTQIPEVNMERYIDITVMQDSIIEFGFAGKTENTGVKLVSGTNTQYALIGEFLNFIPNYQAKGTTIRVYGDVTRLDCNFNGEKITGLDFSHNKEMKDLFCMGNSITSLDLSDNKNLSMLYCQDNLLTSLNISNDTALMNLYCENNKLTSLVMNNNTNLKYLYCHDNNFTTEALDDIFCALPLREESDNATIIPIYNASSANYEIVIATDSKNAKNKKWKVLYFDTFEEIPATTGDHICIVGEVNESHWIELKVAKGDSIQFDFAVNVSAPIRIESGTYSKTIMADDVWCQDQTPTDKYYAQDSIIRIYGDITGFNCNENGDKLTELDASHNPALEELYCSSNELTSLNVSNNPALLELYCVLNQLTSLDIRSCTALGLLVCAGNQLTYLDISNNTALDGLICHANQLTSLDITNNTALTGILCFDNPFTTQALDNIYCSLPLRPSNDKGVIMPIMTSFSANSSIVKKSNSQNAIAKNWEVLYAEDNTVVVTTGTHDCSTAIPATVTTLDATNITYNSAMLSGIVAPGTDVIAERGFEWKETTSGTYTDLVSSHITNTFDANLTNLNTNTNYTYRAYVKVGSNKIYGAEKSFTTKTLVINENSWIELTVTPGDSIQLNFLCSAENTVVMIESGNYNKTIVVGTDAIGLKNYYADSTIMRVYGNISEFNCSDNISKVTKLDASHNTELVYLNCSFNSVSSLDVTGNTALIHLDCHACMLTSLDVSTNTALEKLYCSDNSLTSLDISNNTALILLDCSNNNLSTQAIDNIYCALPLREAADEARIYPVYETFSSNHEIVIATNKENAKAKGWNVWYFTNNTEVPTTGNYICESGIELMENNVAIYPNPAKNILNITSEEQIESIELYNILGKLVLSKAGVSATESTIDVSSFTHGIYILKLQTEKGAASYKISIE